MVQLMAGEPGPKGMDEMRITKTEYYKRINWEMKHLREEMKSDPICLPIPNGMCEEVDRLFREMRAEYTETKTDKSAESRWYNLKSKYNKRVDKQLGLVQYGNGFRGRLTRP
jgi:hypothetical protein